MSRNLFVITQVLLLTCMMVSVLNMRSVKAQGTVYIRSDGSVDPPSAPIQRDGDLYTLTGSITSDADGIVVERNGITLDGAHYAVQGVRTGETKGLSLQDRSGVTIRNMNITSFNFGVRLDSSSENSIVGNNITGNELGVYIRMSSRNNIIENNFTNDGLFVSIDSFSNVVNRNYVNGKPLVYLEGAQDVAVDDAGQVILINCDNIRVENLNLSSTAVGLELRGTNNSQISRNNMTRNNWYGIMLVNAFHNNIVGNDITANNLHGIWLFSSSNFNSISRNNITANALDGISVDSAYNNTIVENSITAHVRANGVEISWCANNTLSGNDIVGNNVGVSLSGGATNNSMIGNNIIDHEFAGIQLWDAQNNFIYHNSLVDNTRQVYDVSWGDPAILHSINDWNCSCEGNYWSDYEGQDLDRSVCSLGIGDTPYVIDERNQDHYPLMSPYLLGDVNHDGRVRIVDITLIAVAFGTEVGSVNWNPHADLDGNGRINILDITRAATQFGIEWQSP